MSLMNRLIRPISLLLTFTTAISQPFAIAAMASAAPAPAPIPFFVPDDGDDRNGDGEDLVVKQREVFERLFETPWSAEAWTYPLHEKVDGSGVYKGANQYSQSFDLDIMIAEKVGVEEAGLPDEQIEFARSRGFEYFGVIGTLKTGLATIPVTGVAFSQGSDIAASQSYFMLVDTVDPDSALFNPTPAAEVTNEPDRETWISILVPVFCPDSDCVRACEEERKRCNDAAKSEYDQKVATANAALNSAKVSAGIDRDRAVSSAHNVFDAAKSTAETQLKAALIAATVAIVAAHVMCSFSLLFAFPCVVAAQAVYAAAVAAAQVIHDSSVRLAALQRNEAIELAQAGYASAVAAATSAHSQRLNDLGGILRRDQRACKDAFDACVRDCDPVICDWLIIWIRVR